MDFSFWLQAFRKAQSVSKIEWQKLDPISRWLIATRASVFVITLFAALLAGLLAIHAKNFDFWSWVLLTAGLVLAHATNNLFNDYTDYARGVDEKSYSRQGTQPLLAGYITKKEFFTKYLAITGGAGLICGIWLALITGQDSLVWLMFLVGSLFVLFYTWPLKELALGEALVFLALGPLMIAGGYYVIAQEWSNYVLVAAFPYVLGISSILLGERLDRYESDMSKNIKSLPVLITEEKARRLSCYMFIFPYLIILGLYISGFFHFTMAILILAVPTLFETIAIYSKPRPKSAAEVLDKDLKKAWPSYYAKVAFEYNRRFAVLYVLAVFLDTMIKSFFY